MSALKKKMFYPSDNRCPSLRGIGKPPWSLWLNLCLKFTLRLRDFTDNCMCGVQRRGSHKKITLNSAHSETMQLLCLVKYIFTPELI